MGIALISTGGSARALAAAGLPATEVAAVTGMPEFLDGRVKTLHPADSWRRCWRVATGWITLPPCATEQSSRSTSSSAIFIHSARPPPAAPAAKNASRISISAVSALIRAAAKNHDAVTVVTDPGDYDRILAEFAAGEGRSARH